MKVFSLLVLLSFFVGCSPTSPSKVIETSKGKIQGYEENQVNFFLGIPYAEAPLKDLRWQPPKPVKSWEGIKKADVLGSACMQPTNVGNSAFLDLMLDGYGLAWYEKLVIKSLSFFAPTLSAGNFSEDCLYLNIIAPKNADNLPVMFWIHGGAGRFGSGGDSIYLTSKFAKKDVILVTINYRLGSLGWFAHPALSAESEAGVSGNYASLDQIEALKWVKNNISDFGGDPNNVTIFGESAGGQAVGTLLSSPLSKGLFHKAISQSGSGVLGTRSLRDNSRNRSAEDIGLELAEHFGVNNDERALENLRNIPAEEFIQISDTEKDANLISNVTQIVDGYVFPYMFNEAYRNKSTHNVPYITGFNANEGTTLVPLIFPEPVFNASFSDEDWLDEFWEILLDGFSGEVPESVTAYVDSMEGSDYDAATQVWGDIWFGGPAYYSAQKRSDDGLKTYLYFFERAVPSEKQTIGATHALELAYIFGSFFPFVARDNWDDELSEIMLNDWTVFAKTGVPNDSWPEFSSKQPIARIYGDSVYESRLKDYKVFEALADYFNKF